MPSFLADSGVSDIDQTGRKPGTTFVGAGETSETIMDISRTPPSSKRLFRELASQAVRERYGKGQAIYSQGDVGDAMFRIEHGNVKLAVASKGSKKAAIAILHTGDCFGEACLDGESRRRCTATSIQHSTIDRISKQTMLRRLHDEPAFARLLISHLLLRIGRTEDDLVDQRVNTSEKRLARLLLQMSDFGRRSARGPAVASIDQATLAQVVGTTRSRVSHFMAKFRKKGFINYNGSLQVNKTLLTFLLRPNTPA